MKKRNLLALIWLAGFVNMTVAEVITLATPQLIYGSLQLTGGPDFSLHSLLWLVLIIEASVGGYLIIRLWKGKISKLSNIIGAGITLLFIITLGKGTEGYLLFSVTESICLVSIIGISLSSDSSKGKKSDFSYQRS